jgi:hypothetical protein
MTDWKALARASGLSLSDQELERVVVPLETLEPAIQRFASRLAPEVEPAPVFDPSLEETAE